MTPEQPSPPHPDELITKTALARVRRFVKGESGYSVYPGGIFMTEGPSPFYADLRTILAALDSYGRALDEIIARAPATKPQLYDDWGGLASVGNYDDVASDASNTESWECAAIARAAREGTR